MAGPALRRAHDPLANPSGCRLDHLDPLRMPGGWLPRLPKVDRLVDHLAVAELHDVDGVGRSLAVVGEQQLRHPQIAAPTHPLNRGGEVGGIGVSHPPHLGESHEAPAPLWEFQHHVIVIDLVDDRLIVDVRPVPLQRRPNRLIVHHPPPDAPHSRGMCSAAEAWYRDLIPIVGSLWS